MKDYNEKVLALIERMNRYRAKNNITQAEMAKGIGICEIQISRILNGVNLPSRSTYYKILIYLEENENV